MAENRLALTDPTSPVFGIITYETSMPGARPYDTEHEDAVDDW